MDKRTAIAVLSLCISFAWAAAGCGDSGGSGTAGSTTTSTTPTGGTSTTGTAGTGPGGTGTGASAGSGTGGTGTGGTPTGGTGTGATGGTTGSAGAGGGQSGEVVECDNLECPVPSKFCCLNYNEPAECMAPGAMCIYAVPLYCDGPEDCQSGEVCCAHIATAGPANAYVDVTCTAAATCTGKDYRVVCGASGMCPQGKQCTTSDLLPPYLDCQ